MPSYRCHKVVEAARILDVCKMDTIPSWMLTLDLPIPKGWKSVYVRVSIEWHDRHKPETGGYYVRYQDGYESYSPPEAFENGYKKIDD